MFRNSKAAGAERGVALIVAMIVLVIIGLTSVSVMRGALSSDQLVNNSRVQTLASQAAQIALRYCEAQANAPSLPPGFNLGASAGANDMDWLKYSNWSSGNNIVNDVPDEYMETAESTFGATKAPQCIAQCTVLPDAKTKVLQTNSRGFSPDYSDEDADGYADSGSVVWLQSTVYPAVHCP
jgi:type IV pilus assembly protein PilX